MKIDKAIEIVRNMNRNSIEKTVVVPHKPTPTGVKWVDNSNVCQRHKHVRVSSYNAFHKYINRQLLG